MTRSRRVSDVMYRCQAYDGWYVFCARLIEGRIPVVMTVHRVPKGVIASTKDTLSATSIVVKPNQDAHV